MITGFVGDVGEYLSLIAKNHDPGAIFLDTDQVPKKASITYYTSFGDIGNLDTFLSLLLLTDIIYYCPPSEAWSDSKNYKKFSMQFTTEKYLEYFALCSSKKIIGFNGATKTHNAIPHGDFLDLVDQRKTNQPQIWIAGCSIAHGMGVDLEQRFGNILGQQLDKPVSWLTHPSSSIQWASDQIIRSDIRKNDLIFWGLTSFSRYPFFTNKIEHIVTTYYDNHPDFVSVMDPDRLDDSNQQYQALTAIYRAKSYVEKLGAKLLMMSVTTDPMTASLVSEFPEIIFAFAKDDFYLDLGTDQAHPGPRQHELYAALFLNKLGKL